MLEDPPILNLDAVVELRQEWTKLFFSSIPSQLPSLRVSSASYFIHNLYLPLSLSLSLSTLLGALAKLRKATIASSCPPVHMQEFGSH